MGRAEISGEFHNVFLTGCKKESGRQQQEPVGNYQHFLLDAPADRYPQCAQTRMLRKPRVANITNWSVHGFKLC